VGYNGDDLVCAVSKFNLDSAHAHERPIINGRVWPFSLASNLKRSLVLSGLLVSLAGFAATPLE
jgi:hypothetical protein